MKRTTKPTTEKRKLKSKDKKKVISGFAELSQAIIDLADRQDKYDDNVTRITNAQVQMQNTFDNMIDRLNEAVMSNIETRERDQRAIAAAKSCGERLAQDDHRISQLFETSKLDGDSITKIQKELTSEIASAELFGSKTNSDILSIRNDLNGVADAQVKLDRIIEAHNNKPWYKRILSKI